MAEAKKGKGSDKTPFEVDAQIREVIKRDNKYYSINPNFHFDLKTCKFLKYFYNFTQ